MRKDLSRGDISAQVCIIAKKLVILILRMIQFEKLTVTLI